MANVIAIGEVLIDFVPEQKGTALKNVKNFIRAAGGAPANVVACVSKLGGHGMLLSQVGDDGFGHHLIETLAHVGVDTSQIKLTKEAPTALAFVALDEFGNRDFSFYRNPCADLLYSPHNVTKDLFHLGDILHFGSVDLIESPMKHAHEKAIELAISQHALVSFDPNVRKALWSDLELYQQTIQAFIPKADLIKISDDELEFVTGKKDEKAAINWLFQGRVRFVIVTRGGKGSSFYLHGIHQFDVQAEKTAVVDTTGAGDSFIGAVLLQIATHGVDQLDWKATLEFAAKVAAYVVARPGAIPALPTLFDITKG